MSCELLLAWQIVEADQLMLVCSSPRLSLPPSHLPPLLSPGQLQGHCRYTDRIHAAASRPRIRCLATFLLHSTTAAVSADPSHPLGTPQRAESAFWRSPSSRLQLLADAHPANEWVCPGDAEGVFAVSGQDEGRSRVQTAHPDLHHATRLPSSAGLISPSIFPPNLLASPPPLYCSRLTVKCYCWSNCTCVLQC